MNISEAIASLDKCVSNPSKGLPDEIFYYISRTTPLVNVDLLIKDDNGRTLLIWRDDKYTGKGWHVPGGIVRFKETFEKRLRITSMNEIGLMVKYDLNPIHIHECIHSRRNIRGHFVSLLYRCLLDSTVPLNNKQILEGERGYMKWHDYCPKNLLSVHKIYKKFI